jgi:hypothetical protein
VVGRQDSAVWLTVLTPHPRRHAGKGTVPRLECASPSHASVTERLHATNHLAGRGASRPQREAFRQRNMDRLEVLHG